MLVIFPFEEKLYHKEGLDVHFVGHPLKDVVWVKQSKNAFFNHIGFDPSVPTLGLLPGSREQEVRRLLPEMLKAFDLLQKQIPNLQLLLGQAPMLSDHIYEPFLNKERALFPVREKTYEVMAHSDAVMAASGTATLETAILGTPMVILYKMSLISFLIGRALVRLKNIGLVNIVAGKEVVPEFIQGKAKAEKIAEKVLLLLTDESIQTIMKHDLAQVSDKLGEEGASQEHHQGLGIRAPEEVLPYYKEGAEETGGLGKHLERDPSLRGRRPGR